MPNYDYICNICAYEFEEFQKMSDPLLTVCPKCSGKLERKIGGGGALLFKGSGFYITDYKKNGYKSEKEAKSPAKSEKTAETKEKKNTKKE